MNPTLVLDVALFEIKRSMTLGRSAIWLMLACFPIALVLTLRITIYFATGDPSENRIPFEAWGFIAHYLIPEVICLLGLLLWATPAISTEVESQTWIYLAMRRPGRTWVVLGKYLTSVVWTFCAAVVAATGCVMIIGSEGGVQLWLALVTISLLSCFAHGALYLLIGLVFFRRTMVAAVAYTLLIEYGLSALPSIANQFSINFQLRSLLDKWLGTSVNIALDDITKSDPLWLNLAVLLVMTLVLLGFAVGRTISSEFPTQQDG